MTSRPVGQEGHCFLVVYNFKALNLVLELKKVENLWRRYFLFHSNQYKAYFCIVSARTVSHFIFEFLIRLLNKFALCVSTILSALYTVKVCMLG